MGNDSFTYTISDGNGGFDSANVSVAVVGVVLVSVELRSKTMATGVMGVAIPADHVAKMWAILPRNGARTRSNVFNRSNIQE